MEITVAPVNDPTKTRKVALSSWKHWPLSKEVPGAKMAGREHMVQVSDEQVAEAKAQAERPKQPVVPPEVQRIQAKTNSTVVEDGPDPVKLEDEKEPVAEAPKPEVKKGRK